ncbi:MAG TPA: FmdB family zinc ribbon protein [Caldimonas sp.]|jgi:putative FmdB family regulatory protein|nr:FmdB family zinc ribbon protein [Caldimonas sp.]HEX2540027.1 FmdB family zinc ribbon protein [Caldimonas sp.]
MPIYAYRCTTCGHAQDVLQKISDPLLSVCPACGAATYAKQVTAAGFQLKGSGWYVTDFRDSNGGKAKKPADAEPGAGEKKGDGEAAPASSDGNGAAAKGGDAPAAAPAATAAPAPAPAAPATPSGKSGD